jgi:hypothetical protein
MDTDKMDTCDNSQDENSNASDYYDEDDYDWEMDCPTDNEEPLEVSIMYMEI